MRKRNTKEYGSRIRGAGIICILVIVLTAMITVPCLADVTGSPGKISVKPGLNTQVTITWLLGGDDVWSDVDPVSSSGGSFSRPDDTVVGTVTTSYTVNISGGKGSLTETITIPATVVDLVRQGGYTTFIYRRNFNDPRPWSEDGEVNLSIILSEAVGPLSLRRADLYFQEEGQRQNEITVDRNTKGIKAYADLYLNGSGFIEGNWEVDGQRLETIRKYSSFGQKTTVSTSGIPGIPTFQPGLHTLRFVLTKPEPGFVMPRIAYLVTSREALTLQKLSLSTPEMSAAVSPDSPFQWSTGEKASAYIITFKRTSDGEDVFSALTLDPNYKVPVLAFSGIFTPGERYTWQVKAYEGEGGEIGRSEERNFIAK